VTQQCKLCGKEFGFKACLDQHLAVSLGCRGVTLIKTFFSASLTLRIVKLECLPLTTIFSVALYLQDMTEPTWADLDAPRSKGWSFHFLAVDQAYQGQNTLAYFMVLALSTFFLCCLRIGQIKNSIFVASLSSLFSYCTLRSEPTLVEQRHDIQQSDTQHNDFHHNFHHNDIEHNNAQNVTLSTMALILWWASHLRPVFWVLLYWMSFSWMLWPQWSTF